MARFARFSGLSRQLAVVFVEKYASEVARQQPSARRHARHGVFSSPSAAGVVSRIHAATRV